MTNADRAEELTAQIPEFKIGGENGPKGKAEETPSKSLTAPVLPTGSSVSQASGHSQPPSDKSGIPTLRLHDYACAPWTLAMKLEATLR